ncbi:carbohydrate kinase family protein [Pyrinomonas sp.]|uniref:carbohydrate kinase family protein n=1 Tax=Pyrinomonas sp. TaxID=2080306 RepID=UPI00332689EA
MRFPLALPERREFDCVGFGLNAFDHLIVAPQYPTFDTKTRFVAYAQSAGGQTASTMVGLQRLGMRTAYAGRFGSDEEGRKGLQSLIEEGINVDRAEIVQGARTQIAFIIIDARTGERTILWDRDERLAYAEWEAPTGFAERGRILHMDAHDPLACVQMAREARRAATVVSADIDNIYDGLLHLLPLIDVLISSAEFPRRLTGLTDERAALMEIKARYGCAVVGMTRGTRGALLYHESLFIEMAALPVPGGCRDTTGAGDAFHAGFLYGLLQGEELETCLKMGCAVAALKCRSLGARQALPTRAELEEYLRTMP